jgi:hypothetical protein
MTLSETFYRTQATQLLNRFINLRNDAKTLGVGRYEKLAQEAIDLAINAQQERMHDAFNAVAEPNDWKAPIDTIVPLEADVETIVEAIEFFTAAKAVVTKDEFHFHITSDGYRNGPAGDH